LLLSFAEIRGDGIGFSALYGRYKTEGFLSNVEKGQFSRAARYLRFTGGIYKESQDEDEAKKEWIAGMQKLREEGIEFLSHSSNNIITDDSFTSGTVVISIRYEGQVYDFRLFISANGGKVEPGFLDYNDQYQFGAPSTPTEVEKMLVERISKVISTYNPG